MSLPIETLTPRQIVAELDKYIIGQDDAKRAVAVALRNRFRRQSLPIEQASEIIPKNILMIGPTGVGKTEIARRIAQLARAPFIKVEATKFTEVGYVGRDVDSIVRDLVNVAIRLVEDEKTAEVEESARQRANERIVEMLVDPYRSRQSDPMARAMETFGLEQPEQKPEPEADEDWARRYRRVKEQVENGDRDDETIEIEVDDVQSPFFQVFSPQGMEEMGFDMPMGAPPGLRSKTTRRVTIKEAKELLTAEEAAKLIDRASVRQEAVHRAEQTGIVFIDELDKIAGREGGHGPDVSREGVQRDLLPLIEGSTVVTRHGPVNTDHVLFIGAGAFHVSKPSDLIPELQGRLPIRVELESLQERDLRRILNEPKNALTRQYINLLAAENVNLEFTDEALDEIARMAHEVNGRAQNIGARRLHTVMERLLEVILYDAPDDLDSKSITIDAEYVRERLASLVKDEDLTKYIL
ncbi:MAG: ATP-dependent protease ATPase subunit HslU [Fimbriimonadales bacterium]